jgi:hypothetical protein
VVAQTTVPGDEVIDRVDAIVDFPWEVFGYERWVEEQVRQASGPSDDYLFGEQIARFIPDDADVLVALAGLRVEDARGGAVVRLSQEKTVTVPSLDAQRVRRILEAIDGVRALAAIPGAARVAYGELMTALRALFGVAVFAPGAVEKLEGELSGTEITRFPGAPYEIERPYWRNMIAVRRALGGLDQLAEQLATNPSASRFLRRLHVLALMGDDLDTFYKPASPISARGVRPGSFLVGSGRTLETPEGTLFLDGPRANVSLVGGELYHRALYAVLDDPDALEPRGFVDSDGLDWGRVVRVRARHDERVADWFFSPLRSAIQVARIQQPHEVARQLSRFHYHFVHLHPFRCANQCVAMSLVNRVLTQSHGVGMPHHILDHLALRLGPTAYERAFVSAVAAYALPGLSPLERYRELGARKVRFYDFLERLGRAGSVAGALNEVQNDLEAARLALFSA